MDLRGSDNRQFLRSRDADDHYDPSAIALTFSGGGYRATLYHTGAILRLAELGLLGKASRIASVSGGSITTGILAMNWNKLGFNADGVPDAQAMQEHLVRPVLRATAQNVDVSIGIKGFLPGISAGNALADTYDKNIFKWTKLKDIPVAPRFIFCATNLQTSGLFRFERDALWDWRALKSTTQNVRLSQAVAASSAFPPVLSPMRLDLSQEDVEVPGGARFDLPALLRQPVLVDGGVYDNLGLEPVWKGCGVIFASSAGQNAAARTGQMRIDHMLPVTYTFLDSSIDWRERVLVYLYKSIMSDGLPERAGAYWTIASDPARFDAWSTGWKAAPALLARAKAQRTRLKRFSRADQEAAILSGYSYADAAIRSYALKDAPPPDGPPVIPQV